MWSLPIPRLAATLHGVHYAKWVATVFHAFAEVARDQPAGVALAPVAETLGLGTISWEEFAKHCQPGRAS